MSQSPPRQPRSGFPVSPCVDICALDDDDYCLGCRRSVSEIIGWATMSAERQWEVVRALAERGNRL